MSLIVTSKGYHRLSVNGVHFSNHSQQPEAIEKASKVLEADPTVKCAVVSPTLEIVASKGSIVVQPAPEPVISDGGEDLFDFLERHAPTPRVEIEVTAPTLMEGLENFLDSTRVGWLIQKFYHKTPDGVKTLVAYGWRGYGLVVHRRVKGTIKIGGTGV